MKSNSNNQGNPDSEKNTESLKWVRKTAKLLDSQYTFPGTGFKFGLDPLIGLFPGLGDLVTFSMSSLLIIAIIRKGASGKVIALMVINVLIDTILGAIPIIGNLFDFFYKSNERNLRLLQKHHEEGKYQGDAKGVIVLALLVLFLIFAGFIYLFAKLVAYLGHA